MVPITIENKTSNRGYNFLILTRKNLSSTFFNGKNHDVKPEESNDCFISHVPPTHYKNK